MKDITRYPIPVNFRGKQVGLQYEDGTITFSDKDAEKEINEMIKSPKPVSFSSRAMGTVTNGKITIMQTKELSFIELNKKSND